jgi:sialate O-acetylesterase
MTDLLIGDVWVMNGQSNMGFALKGIYDAGFESSMAHLPLLRTVRIRSGAESEYVETDLRDKFINGEDDPDKNWKVVTPEVALEMGAIGYVFGSRLQRSLQIPIGIIDNARGGASIESLVPRHKFATHPDAAAYLAWVDARRAAFSEEAFLKEEMVKWEKAEENYQSQIAADKAKGVDNKRKRPNKPTGEIRTWSVPGRSPSDAAACYNGMFGVFKGLRLKGVAFHQGFNNSMMNTSCKPAFYRVLMKLMIDGWREDFQDPNLPVAVIGFCAGGEAQTRKNFEELAFAGGPWIREAQRLALEELANPAHAVYIASHDEKIPQLHTKKKVELGLRAARWALHDVYGLEQIEWDPAPKLVSVEPRDGTLLLTFDTAVRPDDFGSEIEGFSIADDSGIFYMAAAEHNPLEPDKNARLKQIVVSSPLVKEPKFVRYAWATSPMGNLAVNGLPWQPLFSFRTDTIPFAPEVAHQDPEANAKNSAAIKRLKAEASEALKARLAAGANP